ncbi:MAG: response regulator [Chloroflexi bacterium]|nr:MAG: response regulator [Chloroflexota bacterium]
MQAHILVVDDDKIISKTLTLLLNRLGYQATSFNNPVEALKWLQLPGNYPDLVISDVTMPEMSGYEFVSRIRANPLTSHLPVIMLTASGEIDKKIEGFKVGADDYLVKPVDRAELEWRIKAMLARSQAKTTPQSHSEAAIFSVFSLRGGVGTTSISVNLAIALAYLWNKPVSLVDLALKNGHCAMMLNLKPKHTLSSIAAWDTSVIEADTMEKLLLKHETGVRTLPAPFSPAEAELITVPVIDRVWPYLRASFPFIVVDAGSQLVEPNLTVLERSHNILLIVTPELASLKAAVDALKIFDKIGIDRDRVLPVINWVFPDSGLPQHNIEAALKTNAAAVIPYNKTAFVQAINTGKPAITTNATSKTSMALAALAYKLSGNMMKDQASQTPSKWLKMAQKLAQAA